MKYTYPHIITNGGGEELTFMKLIKSGSDELLEVENRVKPGAGPPMHVHHLQDESLTVVQGLMAAKISGKEPTFHGPGETVTFTRGTPHRFWNAGSDDLICKGWISPVNNIEYRPDARPTWRNRIVPQPHVWIATSHRTRITLCPVRSASCTFEPVLPVGSQAGT